MSGVRGPSRSRTTSSFGLPDVHLGRQRTRSPAAAIQRSLFHVSFGVNFVEETEVARWGMHFSLPLPLHAETNELGVGVDGKAGFDDGGIGFVAQDGFGDPGG